jgi:serine/threonine protein kinase/lipoprotein NlpI
MTSDAATRTHTGPVSQPAPDDDVTVDSASRTRDDRAGGPATGRPGPGGGDRFDLRGLLGRGGAANVWLGWDPVLQRQVAVKQLHATDPRRRARFIAEAQVAARLAHPNTVPVYEVCGIDDAEPYLVMQPIDGSSLEQILQRARQSRHAAEPTRAARRPSATDETVDPDARTAPVADTARDESRQADPRADVPSVPGPGGDLPRLADLLDAFERVCDAVAYAHSLGILHRDIKPANVMIGRFGEVFLLDWGLARIDDPSTGEAASAVVQVTESPAPIPGSEPTADGAVKGTINYMAPEQAQGDIAAIGPHTDVYGLGGLLFAILTTHPPRRARASRPALSEARVGAVVPWREAAGHAPWKPPHALIAVALKALSADPGDRYASVAALQADLHAWREHRRVSAVAPTVWGAARRAVQRRPATIMVAAAALATIALVAGLLLALQLAESRDLRQETRLAESREDQLLARIDRERAESARERADSDRREAERQAHLAETAAAAANGRLAEVRRLLNADAVATREDAIRTFDQLWQMRERTRLTKEQFAEVVGEEELARFEAAFTRLIEEVAPRTGLDLTTRDYFYRGFIRSLRGDWRGAVADYGTALRAAPTDFAARLHRGLAMIVLNRPNDAIADFTAAIEADPRRASPYINRGIVYKDMLGDLESAVADFDKAIEADPLSAKAYINRGAAFEALGRPGDALADYDRAVELDPDDFIAVYNRGNQRLARGELADALTDFDRAIDLNPDHAQAWVNRGVIHKREGRRGPALADFDEAIRRDPTVWQAWANRGAIRIQEADPAERAAGIADLQQAWRLCPSEQIRAGLARELATVGAKPPDGSGPDDSPQTD